MRLRITSGELKGRFINVPKSDLIRPTTERVRQTIFNILTNKISFEEIKVLDIYAGSGALGFECISRGAGEIHFVEKNPVIYKNLQENIKSLQAENNCKVFKMPALKFSTQKLNAQYDLILADPPFFKDDIYNVVDNILNNGYLHSNCVMIVERSIQTKQKDINNFKVQPFKIIGDACLYEITYSAR
ncbi:MAG: 16S rRNA (guanine(966)-N(2))-methyltransferase RsmD [Ignavibacteriaceae bacterium]|nr:16S rRNA (guanine(966)-N(2))-methyltransferase RsmD [Ignavibacteriaceae bacterium]MCW8812476.1 16S rRNA (guanine(966)-N(2))-methyltransferase RsmD [Chlorobium sp.]MCW8818468.1 16S rRNA (guanine(966)-N(2))-methyltransferase RsmD [Ignavibacteriaceae bacterium]MCW8824589.1 16S rRNA (guanine(966)-N(2))-methyltransferase RsmD [Ignavibacteriaceae bacterium]